MRLSLNRNARGDSETTRMVPAACMAPQVQLYFRPTGDVRVCCRNETPLGNITSDRLRDIWFGSSRLDIADALIQGRFPTGCGHCAAEVATEGRIGSYPEQFDTHLEANDAPAERLWPKHMEFVLSINCNLQCGQCNGDASSAIRLHREHRDPLASVFGEEFFEDLRGFIPHLTSASFSGGEPFLAEENYRAWDLIAELNPALPVTIITNATRWTSRVESVLRRLRCSFRLSIDGVTPSTYESIRVGADFEEVMANVERFVMYARSRGTDIGINHCLMPQNAHEFADLLKWADSLDLPVFVSVVRDDVRLASGGEIFSIVRSDPREINAVLEVLLERDTEMMESLGRNRPVWVQEVDRIRAWARSTPQELRQFWGVSSATVLMFRAAGAGPTSDVSARSDLASFADDGQVHTVVWGQSEAVVRTSESFHRLVGGEAARRLVGGSPRDLIGTLERALGSLQDYRVSVEEEDRVEAVARFAHARVRVVMLPIRDEHGWAETANQLLAVARAS